MRSDEFPFVHFPDWPVTTVAELIARVPYPPETHAWARQMGSDFERAWRECEHPWMLVLMAALIVMATEDEIGEEQVALAVRVLLAGPSDAARVTPLVRKAVNWRELLRRAGLPSSAAE